MAFLNETGLERLWAHILAKVGAKVDKVDGKGLSTNDYTDEDKNKILENSEAVNSLNTLVGDKSVSEQINEAIIESAVIKPFPVTLTDNTFQDVIVHDLENKTFYYLDPNFGNAVHFYGGGKRYQNAASVNSGIIYYHVRSSEGTGIIYGKNAQIFYLPDSVDGTAVREYKTTDYLPLTNHEPYDPKFDYDPATKKYVDDLIAEIPAPEKSNWAQNDPEAADYIRNRTHWVEVGSERVTVLATTDIIPVEELPPAILDSIELISGSQYVVKFSDGVNSVEYTTVCTDMPENSDGVKWVLGDSGLLSGEPVTGEPFVVLVIDPVYVPDIGFGAFVLTVEAFTTISIDGFNEVIHKIDPKFLPDQTLITVEDIDTICNASIEYANLDEGAF